MNEYNELFAALAKAQADFTHAEKNALNPHFGSSYADMASIMNASRRSLSAHGLCVLQLITQENSEQYLVTRLGHSSGQYIESKIKLLPSDNKIQSLGSYLTYLRRYTYSALVGIAPEEEDEDDDDGEKSMGRGKQPMPRGQAKKEVKEGDEFISQTQLEYLYEIIEGDQALEAAILVRLKRKSLKECRVRWYTSLIGWIQEQKAKIAEQQTTEEVPF